MPWAAQCLQVWVELAGARGRETCAVLVVGNCEPEEEAAVDDGEGLDAGDAVATLVVVVVLTVSGLVLPVSVFAS